MPETAVIPITVAVLASLVGLLAGWSVRGKRAKREKAAIIAGWRTRFAAEGDERERLLSQNRYLMEQVGELKTSDKASGTHADSRVRELSAALREAFANRDELKHQITEIRGNLEAAVEARDRPQSDIGDTARDTSSDKDDKIFGLSRELANWQQRLPPLLARFHARNEQARRLEIDLEIARKRIAALEERLHSEQARVEALHDKSKRITFEVSDDPAGADAGTERAAPVGIAAACGTAATSVGGAITPRDNLRLIEGVGPAIEKTLNELGIFHFHQLAKLSDYDVERIGKRFRGVRSRIEREDWIGQARNLESRQPVVGTGH